MRASDYPLCGAISQRLPRRRRSSGQFSCGFAAWPLGGVCAEQVSWLCAEPCLAPQRQEPVPASHSGYPTRCRTQRRSHSRPVRDRRSLSYPSNHLPWRRRTNSRHHAPAGGNAVSSSRAPPILHTLPPPAARLQRPARAKAAGHSPRAAARAASGAHLMAP